MKYLHWISAIVILWASITGLYIAFFEINPTIKSFILNFNVSITVVFIPIFCYRIYVRLKHGVPDAHSDFSPLEKKLAHIGHTLLYIVISIVLISGVLMMDNNISVFHLFTLSPLIQDLSITHFFEVLHLYTCRILAVLVTFHIIALIKHELMGRRILKKMI
ncbi:hypothetical protein CXF74_21235 [Psychromonas sp. Urea-02u-13]|nr:hypothetical protein CXF74_21235 [Psychromonas sp. Urea-02u-13]